MNKNGSIIYMNENGILSHQTLRIWLISVRYVNISRPYNSILSSHAQMHYVNYYYMYSIEVGCENIGTKEGRSYNKIRSV